MKSPCHGFLEGVRPGHAAVSCHLPIPVPETQSHRAVTGAFSFCVSPSRRFSSDSLLWHSGTEFSLYSPGLSVTHSPPSHTFPKRQQDGPEDSTPGFSQNPLPTITPTTATCYLKVQSTCFVLALSCRKVCEASGLQHRAGDQSHGQP